MSTLSSPEPEDDDSRVDDTISAELDMEVLRRRMSAGMDPHGRVGGMGGTGATVEGLGQLGQTLEDGYNVDDLLAWDSDALQDTLANGELDDIEYGWVLLFHPNSEEEGVYTVQDDDATTFVLAFQDQDDATRFAQQLEAENFDLPAVAQWDMDMLTDFCEDGDYKIGLVPTGVMLMPPRQNYYRDDLLRQEDHEGEMLFRQDEDGTQLMREDSYVSPLSGETAPRVNAELVSRLDNLFAAEAGRHPFEALE